MSKGMGFLAAMTAACAGHLVRREAWANQPQPKDGPLLGVPFVTVSGHAQVFADDDGQPRVRRVVKIVDPLVSEEAIYYASADDREANDWETCPAPVAVTDSPVPSSPAPEANAQPVDAGDGAAASLDTQGTEEQPVGLAPGGAPAAAEAAPAVQEVVQDASAAAPASGVEEG